MLVLVYNHPVLLFGLSRDYIFTLDISADSDIDTLRMMHPCLTVVSCGQLVSDSTVRFVL